MPAIINKGRNEEGNIDAAGPPDFTGRKLECDDDVIHIPHLADLPDLGVGGGVGLVGVLAQDPGDHVDVVHRAVVEDAPGDGEVLQRGQGAVARRRLDHVHVTDLTCRTGRRAIGTYTVSAVRKLLRYIVLNEYGC